MGSQSSRLSTNDQAVLELKVQRDKIRQYQRRLDVLLSRETGLARDFIKQGQKDKALLALRQKRHQESLLRDTDKHLESLEQMVSTIEFKLVEHNVLYGLKQGNAVLLSLNKKMSLKVVEQIMDDSEEGIAYQKELSDMLASSNTAQDEADALQEYNALIQEFRASMEEQSQPVDDIISGLPAVPNSSIALNTTKEENERRTQAAVPAT